MQLGMAHVVVASALVLAVQLRLRQSLVPLTQTFRS